MLSRVHAKPLAKQHLCHHSEGLCSTWLKDDHQGLTASSVPDHLDMDLSVQTDVQYLWESSAKKLGQGSTKKCKLDTHLAAKCLLWMDRTCSILEDTIHWDRAVTCMGEMAPAFTPTGLLLQLWHRFSISFQNIPKSFTRICKMFWHQIYSNAHQSTGLSSDWRVFIFTLKPFFASFSCSKLHNMLQ